MRTANEITMVVWKSENGDTVYWQALYLDGKLAREGPSVSELNILNALEVGLLFRTHDVCCGTKISQDGAPKKLEELPPCPNC